MILKEPRPEEANTPHEIIIIYRCGHKAILNGEKEIRSPDECLLCKEAKKRWRGIDEEEARATITGMISEWQAQGATVSADVLAERILHVLNYLTVA